SRTTRLVRAVLPRPGLVPSAVALAAVVAIATLVVVVVSPGTAPRAEAFPILDQPAVAATGDDANALSKLGRGPNAVHRFDTPYGPGYLSGSQQDGQICLAAPDPTTSDLGGTCRSLAAATRSGIWLTFAGGSSSADPAGEYVAALPAGASAPVLTYKNGSTRVVDLQPGNIAVAAVHHDATIAVDIDGAPSTVAVPVTISSTVELVDCGPHHGGVHALEPGQTREQVCGHS